MKILEWEARIENNKINHITRSVNAEQNFYAENNGKTVLVKMEVIEDKIRDHQHRFYRGYLLPAISEHINGTKAHEELELLHTMLKDRYLKYPIERLSDVKKHHKKRNTILVNEKIVDGEQIIEYISCTPSMADLTKEEAYKYIMAVWMFACTDLEIGIDEQTQRSYTDYIDAYKVEKVITLFSGEEVKKQ